MFRSTSVLGLSTYPYDYNLSPFALVLWFLLYQLRYFVHRRPWLDILV